MKMLYCDNIIGTDNYKGKGGILIFSKSTDVEMQKSVCLINTCTTI